VVWCATDYIGFGSCERVVISGEDVVPDFGSRWCGIGEGRECISKLV